MTPRSLLFFSLILHLLAALFNVGYQYHDEHFQIIEFASYKLGQTPSTALAWEFHSQIRSWFLPGLTYTLFKFLEILGFTSAYSQVLFCKLVFSFLGWASLVWFYSTATSYFNLEKLKFSIWLWISLFWFFPYLHVRTSSENVSASLFLIGLSLFLQSQSRSGWRSFGAGIFFGFSFLARFQTGLMIFGTLVYSIFIALRSDLLRTRRLEYFQNCGMIVLGLFVSIGMGGFIDYWGYGEWTNSALNYFRINLVEHRADEFGVGPWWQYFVFLWEQVPLGLGIYLSLIFLLSCFLLPFHLLTWASLPFILVHLAIGHKELRFIYPLTPFVPFYCAYFTESFKHLRVARYTQILALILSGILILPAVFKAERNTFHWLGYISVHFKDSLKLVGWAPDPFMDVLPIYHYRPKNYSYLRITTPQQLQKLVNADPVTYVFRPESKLPPEFEPIISDCTLVYEVFPVLFRKINVNHWLDRAGNWGLYRCSPQRDLNS